MELLVPMLTLNSVSLVISVYCILNRRSSSIPALVSVFILTMANIFFHGVVFGNIVAMEYGILDGNCVNDRLLDNVKPICEKCNLYTENILCVSLNLPIILDQIIFFINMTLITIFFSKRMREIWNQDHVYDSFGEFLYRQNHEEDYNRFPPYATERSENKTKFQKITHTFCSFWFCLYLIFLAGYTIPPTIFIVMAANLDCEDVKFAFCV